MDIKSMEVKTFEDVSFHYVKAFVKHISENLFGLEVNATELLEKNKEVNEEHIEQENKVIVMKKVVDDVHIVSIDLHNKLFGSLVIYGEFQGLNMVGDIKASYEPIHEHVTLIDLIVDFEEEYEIIQELNKKEIKIIKFLT